MSQTDRDWRQKYREALTEFNAKEVKSSKLESTLRLLIGRLCLAGQGRDPALDAELVRVANAVRKGSDSDELHEYLAPLSQAVAVLDAASPKKKTAESSPAPATSNVAATPATPAPSSPPPPAAPASANTEPEVATLPLLDRLALLPELQETVAELRGRREESLSAHELVELLHRVARLASEQRTQVQRERLELEDLVQQTSSRLAEIETHLAGELAERDQVHDETSRLNLLVTDEVEQLRLDAEKASEISQLRRELNARLGNIATHVHDFQAREESRAGVYRERTQKMRARIASLERESRNLQQNLKQEQQQAMIDALTGIPNRAAYDDRVAQEFKRWRRFARPVSLITWDVDGFKGINDAFGHKAGDKVLRIVGQQLVRHVRDTDFVARYGGDEFVMLLVGSDREVAHGVAEKIRGEIAALGFHFHDRPVQVTMSCGITSFGGEDDVDIAFDRADRALYQAKKAGKNRCATG
jgi:diguanylate cyclase